MKLLAGCAVSAGLLVIAWSANAQMLAPHGARAQASELSGPYGAHAALPSPFSVHGVPRPPAPIPNVANHDATSRPVPSPASKAAETAAAQPHPQPHLSSATPPTAAGAVSEARPTQPVIRPTQDMPPVQPLE